LRHWLESDSEARNDTIKSDTSAEPARLSEALFQWRRNFAWRTFVVPAMTAAREPSQGLQAATPVRFALGAAAMIAHTFTGAGFGFHGDELQFMDDARHLAWGYVAYPPMTPFFARLSLDLFGTSLAGFRFFASLAQAVAIILTGLTAREMGSLSRSGRAMRDGGSR
jgi:hypothetical protein